MVKIKDKNACIRIDRDEKQITKCKKRIEKVSSNLSAISQILALVGNEVRFKILLLFQDEQRLCVCDLAEILGMKIPAVSQHLRKLKDARLIYSEREGTVIFYQINPKLKPTLTTILNLLKLPTSS